MADRRNRRGSGGLAGLLLNIAIVLAVLILAVNIVGAINGLREDDYSIFRQVRSQFTIEDHRYGQLIQTYYDEDIDVAGEEGYDLDALSVARYADASFRLKVYKTFGDDARAEQMRKRMQEAKTHMGIYVNQTDMIKDAIHLIEY